MLKTSLSKLSIPTGISFVLTLKNRSLNEIVEEIEKSAILQALEKSGGNKAKAAVRLGIPASTLKSKIYKYGLD